MRRQEVERVTGKEGVGQGLRLTLAALVPELGHPLPCPPGPVLTLRGVIMSIFSPAGAKALPLWGRWLTRSITCLPGSHPPFEKAEALARQSLSAASLVL